MEYTPNEILQGLIQENIQLRFELNALFSAFRQWYLDKGFTNREFRENIIEPNMTPEHFEKLVMNNKFLTPLSKKKLLKQITRD